MSCDSVTEQFVHDFARIKKSFSTWLKPKNSMLWFCDPLVEISHCRALPAMVSMISRIGLRMPLALSPRRIRHLDGCCPSSRLRFLGAGCLPNPEATYATLYILVMHMIWYSYICTLLYVCYIYICVCVYAYMYICDSMYIYIYTIMYIYIYICVCVCMFVCVCWISLSLSLTVSV